ncbi:putative homeodomain transcription factor [Agrilus planipennis]|uniref:Homeodomain transcription factor n=1 Tax=Agrilus planipennis TaxID=224129 RepID=A0A1W4WVT4_AGRPL|nr:putative homeodomain transcription factor [Agrilus planipennis]
MVHEMGVQDTVAWYQKKIGTYDKQQWELSFERHIIRGYNHVKTKSARLKTELIDVDLVQVLSLSLTIRPRSSNSIPHMLDALRNSFKLANVLQKVDDAEKYPSEEDDDEKEDEVNTESQTSSRRFMSSYKAKCASNSEENYYATELDQSEGDIDEDFDFGFNPDCSTFDKVSCTIWDKGEVKKAYLTVLDISSAIIRIVEQMPECIDYFYLGLIFSLMLAFTPVAYRLSTVEGGCYNSTNEFLISVDDLVQSRLDNVSAILISVINKALGNNFWERAIMLIASLQRFILAWIFFFLLVVAERTYKQRFFYAKFFTKLTSSQKAKKWELPHFRLNKVKNIKTWLSVRSYLKKRGPQRSVDVIVSSSFVITLLLLSFLSMELLKGSEALRLQYNLEALIWSFGLGIMLLRFMTLANKTYLKYRNLSVLITEQINLYLQIERKPRKKEKLGIVHNVLKLAADLLKELETPYTISGLSANPYLYTIVKVFILSALSAVLSEMLGFKLKLFKLSMKH